MRMWGKVEESVDSQRVHVSEGFNKLVFIGNGGDAIEQRLEWGAALRVDGLFIHAGCIKIADLLRDRVMFGTVGGSFFQDLVQELAVVFGQFIKTAPTRLIRRNGIFLSPFSASIFEECFAGVPRFIHCPQSTKF